MVDDVERDARERVLMTDEQAGRAEEQQTSEQSRGGQSSAHRVEPGVQCGAIVRDLSD